MIFSSDPTDWSDLQNKVAQVFKEIGCVVEIEKEISLTRGSVNVDVYVQDITKSPNLTYICECKYWETQVPKSIVHAFRTVVTDCGAHAGFLISKNGYQSGAYQAGSNSNILLLTWNEFQYRLFDAWYNGMWKRVYSASLPILKYLRPPFFGNVDEIIRSNEEARSLYYAMFKKFSAYGEAILYPRNLIERTPLPITIIDPRHDYRGEIKLDTYREYFEILLSSADYATETFEYFVAKYQSPF